MTCCAIARCDDPNCQVCTTVERGFPKAVFQDFTRRRPRRFPTEDQKTTTVEQGLFTYSRRTASE